MDTKWIPVVRYNPYNKIFKWEWGKQPECVVTNDGPRRPSGVMKVKTESIFGPRAALTKRAAVRRAERAARKMNEFMAQRELVWERAVE